MQVGPAGAGGTSRCRWDQQVQVGPAGAGGTSRCRWEQQVQVGPAGAGGTNRCRWDQQVQVGPAGFRLIRGTLKPRNKIVRILCVLGYMGENNKDMQLRVTSPSGEADSS